MVRERRGREGEGERKRRGWEKEKERERERNIHVYDAKWHNQIFKSTMLCDILYISVFHLNCDFPLAYFSLVATSGRMDCMFQVLPDQEDSISMGDILSDGLLVVELDPSGRLQAIPETPTNPQILFSPEEEAK